MTKWIWVLGAALLLLVNPPEQWLLRALNPAPAAAPALSMARFLDQQKAAHPGATLVRVQHQAGRPWAVAEVAKGGQWQRDYLHPATGERLDLRGGRPVAAWVMLAEAVRAWLLAPPLALLWMLAGLLLLVWRCGLWPRPAADQSGSAALLVAYASQTGNAEQLARQAAAQLGGVPVLSLNELSAERLQQCQTLVLVISTHGEGAPPDNAALFARRLMAQPLPLSQLNIAVLALGDRRYPAFCGFASAVSDWFVAQGASCGYPNVLVDNLDPQALDLWHQQLKALGAVANRPVEERRWQNWTLQARHCLNPGSPAAPVYRLVLQPPAAGEGHWQAGDLAYLAPPDEPQTVRAYSIASVADDGALELLVREQRQADGRPGRLSGWLGAVALSSPVRVQLRANSGFHGPEGKQTPMLLIGSGTGLAGLRSHLRERWQQNARDNWLIFGERWPDHDRLCEDELLAWLQQGHLHHLDRVFSRGEYPQQGYVQQRLAACQQQLQDWLARGAAIYVCGGLAMGEAVDATLRQLLGDPQVDQLLAERRYRRDVY